MIGRGLLLLTVLSNCVLSLPVTSSQLENEDVEVMKCIVEALADVLSRPKKVPVSQECLKTLRTDKKLLTILRHHNFLKELQEIAGQGDPARVQLQKKSDKPIPTTQVPYNAADSADRSMLEALGGPGERSILSQKKRAEYSSEEKDGPREEESKEDSEAAEEHVRRDEDENKRGDEHDERQTSSEENSEEEKEMEDKTGDLSNKKKDSSREKSRPKLVKTEVGGKSDKRSGLFSEKENEEQEQKEVKREGKESLHPLTHRARTWQRKKKAGREEGPQFGSQQEESHHSKEEAGEDKQKKKKKRDPERTTEERELQMIAQGAPGERQGMEEEGSGTRRSEDPEIESLAAIESELENVGQKLHELRRG